MQLRKPQPFAVLDHHHAGPRHVHTDLDHRGGDQDGQLAGLEGRHHRLFLRRLHASVQKAHAQTRQRGRKLGMHGLGGLRTQLL